MLSLTERGKVVVLLQNSGIRVVLSCLKVYITHLGADNV